MRYNIIDYKCGKNNIGSIEVSGASTAIESLKSAGYAVEEDAVATAEVGNIRIRNADGDMLLELC